MSRIDELRSELGGAHPRAATKVKDHLDPYVQAFVRHSPFAVMSSSNRDGDCDASPKGGLPGFIKVVDERTLLIPDVGGNRLFQSYQNFESNPKAGFVFIIPGMDTTARVNGRVRVVEAEEIEGMGIAPEVLNPDDNSRIVQGIVLEVDEAYFHCPRSFRFADLWNAETIAANAKLGLKDLRAALPD
jgi:predicted pyridoxine 5'-phosphate oxidase superfamily flavin-nucleotide-binding protein